MGDFSIGGVTVYECVGLGVGGCVCMSGYVVCVSFLRLANIHQFCN